MTPDNPAFIKLAKSVERIEKALLGDALEGRKGIIHFHDLMVEDLYAVGSDGKIIEGKSNTIPNRVSSLEDKQKKAIWIFTGIAGLAVALKLGISALLEKMFK